MSDIRKDYLKITISFYLIWAAIFILEGLYANTLATTDPSWLIDSHIPVLPHFVWFYVLCYIFPIVPIVVVQDWHRFNLALLSFAMCTFVAFIGHLLLPVAFSKPQLGTSLSENFVQFIYQNDFRPGAQNFPSLHVSFAWIMYLSCRRQGLKKIYEFLILFLALLIILSTVFIKQHLFIDLLGGTFLAIIIWSAFTIIYKCHVHPDQDPRVALLSVAKKIRPLFYICWVVLFLIVGYQAICNW